MSIEFQPMSFRGVLPTVVVQEWGRHGEFPDFTPLTTFGNGCP